MIRSPFSAILRLLAASGFAIFLAVLALVSLPSLQQAEEVSPALPPAQKQRVAVARAAKASVQGFDLVQAGAAATGPFEVVAVDQGEADDQALFAPLTYAEVIPAELPAWATSLQQANQAGSGLVVTLSIDPPPLNGISRANVGEYIVYNISVTNRSDVNATAIQILDDLPRDTLQDISCEETCEFLNDVLPIPDPTGGTVIVTITRQISWTVPSLAPGATIERSFRGKVVGQQDGTTFRNRAFIYYELSGTPTSGTSNEVETIARVALRNPGNPNISSVPTWFSSDLGGTLSQDWADFDLDGDLDLVLASSLGITVYQNDFGRLRFLWRNDGLSREQRLAYGVRWADVTGDHIPEIITVGASVDGGPNSQSTSYIYSYQSDSPSERFKVADTFTSTHQFVRVVAGEIDNQAGLDLVVSTNSINAPCPVRFYPNQHSSSPNNIFQFDEFKCVSDEASANISPADLDNNDVLDLALGLFESQSVAIITNTSVVSQGLPYTNTESIAIDTSSSFLPYDFAWGDYDRDGYLDLAAAFPLQREVRVYRNRGAVGQESISFDTPISVRTSLFRTPLSVDWGDFDRDGHLDLVVADVSPEFYRYDPIQRRFTAMVSLRTSEASTSSRSQFWSTRSIDEDNDGDLDLALTNRDGPSTVYTGFAPQLGTTMTVVYRGSSNGLAWGDANGDSTLDLVFSPSPGNFGTKLFLNQLGSFPAAPSRVFSGFGPHSVAFGDMNKDGTQDLAITTIAEDRVYLSSEPAPSASNPWTSALADDSRTTAWADANDDRSLDLLVGNDNQPLALYLNTGTRLATEPVWRSQETDRVRSVAWADFNNDYFIDFAVGNQGQPTRVYQNNSGNGTFTLVWNSPFDMDARALAWGDMDNDGDQDLIVGDYSSNVYLIKNLTENGATDLPTMSNEPVAIDPNQLLTQTLSIALGDWNSDGDLDLAIGREDRPAIVYANLTKSATEPQFEWLWQSAERLNITGVAWGDADGDGDLDLGVSTEGNNSTPNGYYPNNYVVPSHLTALFTPTMPLPNNPSYIWIDRPSDRLGRSSDNAYFYSSPEVLSGQLNPTVTIKYRLFDPDGSRRGAGSNEPGDPVAKSIFEYSLDGGSSWLPATQAAGSTPIVTQTYRLGFRQQDEYATFIWNAQADNAVSDNARFRIRAVNTSDAGIPIQRASTTTISPPFRVRGLSCLWPRQPTISITSPVTTTNNSYDVGQNLTFLGRVVEGSGILTFTWDFGDSTPLLTGEVVRHAYTEPGVYTTIMTVTGQTCPLSRPVVASMVISVELAAVIYLPIIHNPVTTSPVVGSGQPPAPALPLMAGPPPIDESKMPAPPQKFMGAVESDAGTVLSWQPGQRMEELTGYRVYRRLHAEGALFQMLSTLPANTTRYTDETSTCGHIYYVTALNEAGESMATQVSYATPPCK